VYQENFNSVNTGAFGVINLQIGANPVISGNLKPLKDLQWATKNYYVNIQVGSNNISATPIPQLLSVPYSLHAAKSDTARYALTSTTTPEIDADTTNELQTLTVSGKDITLSNNGGTVTLNFTVNGNKLQLNGTDVATLPDFTPAGTIVAYGGSIPPAGWLLCDGQSYNRTGQYANLFGAIGTNFGFPNINQFNVPDLRGMFLRGQMGLRNDGLGDLDNTSRIASGTNGAVGNNVGSYQSDELKSHNHKQGDRIGSQNVGNIAAGGLNGITDNNNSLTYTSLTGGSETRPKNVYVNYIIKH
jgi:hypothetical protein